MKPRFAPIYAVYVALIGLQAGLAFSVSSVTDTRPAVVAVCAVAVVWLAFRSRTAWWLLLYLNTAPLLAAVAVAVSTAPWAWGTGLWILVATCAAIEATLLSAPMRRYVQARDQLATA
ncbi:MAG TPA: hypothetical protein VKS25_15500 [Solirubrobacteraceae bacterium]|nr:hypothetical protein [Solirubrobacteraceae bacterium]